MGFFLPRKPRSEHLSYVMVAALTLILVGLAALQFSWSNQVSQAERDRMEASLRIATTQFRQDFARELQTLCAGFQPGPDLLFSEDWSGYAAQSTEWWNNSSSPGLVSGLYLWRPGQPLAMLDRAARGWIATPEPAALQPVLKRLGTATEASRQQRGLRLLPWTLDGDVPALFHGLLLFRDPEARNLDPRNLDPREPDLRNPEDRRPGGVSLAGAAIILLNLDYFQTKLLPELATRHFGGPDGLLYQVAVYSAGDAARQVYNSGPPFNQKAIASADVTTDLLEARPRPGDRPPGGPPPGGDNPNQRRGRFPGFRDRRPPLEPGGPPAAFPAPSAARNGFAFQERLRLARRLGLNAPAPNLVAEARTSWVLVVRHRAGSVTAAVASLRLRNLAVSFLILLLLAGSMALIIVAAQRAQRLARLQVDFVAGISHELRTPLAVISSAADNLTHGIVSNPSQVQVYGSLIRQEARRLEGMMENILAFAAGRKARAGQPRLLHVPDLLDRALTLSAAAIAESGGVLEKHIADNLPPVLAGENELVQCFQNLIGNAIKYGGPHPWTGISARCEGDSVVVTIADRGIGIDPGELPFIFDAFYRGSAATDAQIHGTGLGLNLARGFVESANGSLSVESTLGEGSRFTVRLPAARHIPHPTTHPTTQAPAIAERAT